jgi:hypothetical protein
MKGINAGCGVAFARCFDVRRYFTIAGGRAQMPSYAFFEKAPLILRFLILARWQPEIRLNGE